MYIHLTGTKIEIYRQFSINEGVTAIKTNITKLNLVGLTKMSNIIRVNIIELDRIVQMITAQMKLYSNLEDASQLFESAIFTTFKNDIILTRMFAGCEYKDLSLKYKKFLRREYNTEYLQSSLQDKTQILTLLGSEGIEEEWKKTSNSKQHMAIPLITENYIMQSPMICCLLNEIGVKINWLDSLNINIPNGHILDANGIFYIHDALKDKDMFGAPIINQNFVSKYKVKSAFGFGGRYPETNKFYINVTFLNKQIDKEKVILFAYAMSFFNVHTYHLAKKNIFNSVISFIFVNSLQE